MSPLVDSFPLDDSPFVDGQDLDDANFDWDDGGDQLFGDLPGASGHEDDDIHDKRKDHPEDENEDGKSKRHEGNEKNNKKPGRKPLNSSEPTTVSPTARFHPLHQLTLQPEETEGTKSSRSKGVP